MSLQLRYRLSTAAAVFLLAAMTTGMFGCSALGLPSPNTFNEKVAVGYSTVTALRTTAVTLLDDKKISAVDGQNVLQQTDNARAGLDIAREIHATQPDAANSKLTSVLTGLRALDAYLRSRK